MTASTCDEAVETLAIRKAAHSRPSNCTSELELRRLVLFILQMIKKALLNIVGQGPFSIAFRKSNPSAVEPSASLNAQIIRCGWLISCPSDTPLLVEP